MFTPASILTRMVRAQDPTVRQAEERASSKRLAALLHMSTDESENAALDGSPYGLGSARTFEELVKFTGA